MLKRYIWSLEAAEASRDQGEFDSDFDSFRIVARDRFIEVDEMLLKAERPPGNSCPGPRQAPLGEVSRDGECGRLTRPFDTLEAMKARHKEFLRTAEKEETIDTVPGAGIQSLPPRHRHRTGPR